MRRLLTPTLSLLILAGCGGGDPTSTPAAGAEAEPEAAAEEGEATTEGAAAADGDPGNTFDGDPPNQKVPAEEGVMPDAFRPVDIEGAKVYFAEPEDGATVTSPVKIVFGADNVEVEAAGTLRSNAGHHHLILTGEPVEAGTAVPASDTHIHYGQGQTETTVELPPGEHTLAMQFADGLHRSYGPDMAATITITVTE